MHSRSVTRVFATMVVAALLALMSGLAATPAQAAHGKHKASSTTFPLRSMPTGRVDQLARARAAVGNNAVVAQVIPGAYRVCTPYRCVWVEATKYCPPDTGCGRPVVTGPYNGPISACSPSVGCAVINGSPVQLYSNAYDNGEVGRVVRCAAGLGVNAVGLWTRGFSKLALAGVGLTTWGCSNI